MQLRSVESRIVFTTSVAMAKEIASRRVSYHHFRLPSSPEAKRPNFFHSQPRSQPAIQPAGPPSSHFFPVQPYVVPPLPLSLHRHPARLPLRFPLSTAIRVSSALSLSRVGMEWGWMREMEHVLLLLRRGRMRRTETPFGERSIRRHIISAARLVSRFWGRRSASASANYTIGRAK